MPVRSAACGDRRRAAGRAARGCRRRAAARGRPRAGFSSPARVAKAIGLSEPASRVRTTTLRPSANGREHRGVDLGLLLDGRLLGAVEEAELGAEQADALDRALRPPARADVAVGDVGQHLDRRRRRRSRPGRSTRRAARATRASASTRSAACASSGSELDRRRSCRRRAPCVPAASVVGPGDPDDAGDAELPGDDRGVAGRAALLGHQRRPPSPGRARRCRPGRGPRRPAPTARRAPATPGLRRADQLGDRAGRSMSRRSVTRSAISPPIWREELGELVHGAVAARRAAGRRRVQPLPDRAAQPLVARQAGGRDRAPPRPRPRRWPSARRAAGHGGRPPRRSAAQRLVSGVRRASAVEGRDGVGGTSVRTHDDGAEGDARDDRGAGEQRRRWPGPDAASDGGCERRSCGTCNRRHPLTVNTFGRKTTDTQIQRGAGGSRCTPRNASRPSPTCVTPARPPVGDRARRARYGVTTETVRRDLSSLERAGLVRRVHGGAVPAARSPSSSAASATATAPSAEREGPDRHGRAGAAPPTGGSVLLDAGTTTARLAGLLPLDRQLDRVHQRRPDRGRLAGAPASTCTCSPGRVRRDHPGRGRRGHRRGPRPAADRRRVPRHQRRLSVAHGLSTPDHDEAAVKRAMVAAPRRVVVLADSSSSARSTSSGSPTLEQVDVLVTDDARPPPTSSTRIERRRRQGRGRMIVTLTANPSFDRTIALAGRARARRRAARRRGASSRPAARA